MVIAKERIAGQKEEEIKKTGEMGDVRGRDLDKLPHEVESWMTRVEKKGSGDVKQINDDQGQPILTSVSNDDDINLKLPVTRTVFSNGFSLAVNKAGRWLSEFLFRWIKMKKNKVKFMEEDES
jgi:hypothetical protein